LVFKRVELLQFITVERFQLIWERRYLFDPLIVGVLRLPVLDRRLKQIDTLSCVDSSRKLLFEPVETRSLRLKIRGIPPQFFNPLDGFLRLLRLTNPPSSRTGPTSKTERSPDCIDIEPASRFALNDAGKLAVVSFLLKHIVQRERIPTPTI